MGEATCKEMIESKCSPLGKEKVGRHRARIVVVKRDNEFKKYREWLTDKKKFKMFPRFAA